MHEPRFAWSIRTPFHALGAHLMALPDVIQVVVEFIHLGLEGTGGEGTRFQLVRQELVDVSKVEFLGFQLFIELDVLDLKLVAMILVPARPKMLGLGAWWCSTSMQRRRMEGGRSTFQAWISGSQ